MRAERPQGSFGPFFTHLVQLRRNSNPIRVPTGSVTGIHVCACSDTFGEYGHTPFNLALRPNKNKIRASLLGGACSRAL